MGGAAAVCCVPYLFRQNVDAVEAARQLRWVDDDQNLCLRAQRLLQMMGTKVPPRVWAAVWRTLWNGWNTNRRRQGRGALRGCMFGCPPEAADSIEHYACCTRLAAVAGPALGLPRIVEPRAALADFLGLDVGRAADQLAVPKAIRMAAAYKVHCMAAHWAVGVGVTAVEALRQALREVVRGHPGATRVYDTAGWA